MKESYRKSDERVRVTLLLSPKANQKMSELAEQLNCFKYDVVETLVEITDFNDSYIRELLNDHFDDLPVSIQRAIAWTRRLEKKDV